jgi:hypothetical protein
LLFYARDLQGQALYLQKRTGMVNWYTFENTKFEKKNFFKPKKKRRRRETVIKYDSSRALA